MAIVASIPANQFVNDTPQVLAASGTGIVLNGLMLTQSTRPPVGQVLSFPSSSAVAGYFGGASAEAAFAAQYFNGFTNSQQKPGAMLVAQYPESAVAAWLWGGSIAALPLIALQGISGTLAITVDGYARSGAVDLTSAISFSDAASKIQTALNTSLPAGGTSTASTIAANSVIGSIAGTILTVTAASGAIVAVGQAISGTGVTAGTTITGLGTGTGGAGTYTVSVSQTVSSTAIALGTGVLTVDGTVTGTWAIGQTVTGGTTTDGTQIIGLGTGAGAAGTYLVSIHKTVASAALASSATPVAVAYDATSGGLTITSGVAGAASTVTYPTTGTVATALNLTSATGAVVSQGADAVATPGAFMSELVQITSNWAAFALLWQAAIAENLAFATWNSAQNNCYAFAAWDTDITVLGNPKAYTGLGAQVALAGLSGIELIYAPANQYLAAAFFLGYAASLNFSQQDGRTTIAYRSASGLVPDVTNQTAYQNMVANGYNAYVNVATANQQLQFFQPGKISGPFTWADSYVNQIWLNGQFIDDMLSGLAQFRSIPYNADGDTKIRSLVQGTIQEAGNFGVFRSGVTLSESQVVAVTNAVGANAVSALQSNGYYLYSNAAGTAPSIRQVRGSPPFSFYYTDGEDVQTLNLQSVLLQ